MADQNSQTRTARRKQQGKKTKKRKKQPIWKKIIKVFLLLILLLFLGGAAVGAFWIAQAPDIDDDKLHIPFSSTLYDKNGDQFADLSSDEKRKQVKFEELPDLLIDAVTATEDVRFFEHNGVDIRRIGGAIRANITSGFGAEGASTITQQVVERAFLTPEKKISIKVQEAWLAMKLEREYSKEEILEMYLNSIFYGANSYGVAQAANTYFGKEDLNDLTLPEVAILAGLPQRPTAYNPFENPDLTKERMNTVLTLMVRHGKITQEEADEARNVDIPSLLNESRPDPTPYDAFVQQVREEIEEKMDDVDLDSDGLKVYTTLDPDAQPYVEDVLTESDSNPISYPEDTQAAMVVLDTQTGAIQAIGGSLNNEGNMGFNFAINGKTQAGSTAKPIMSYGPAIEYNQMSTYHQLDDDGPYEIEGSNPIRNATRTYNGWVTARYALQQSLNVPAVKLMEEVGRENSKEFAENLGIEFDSDYLDLREAIGGTNTQVTPLQMAGAYSAFGNEGTYTEPYAVTKVEFSDGREVDLTPDSAKVMEDYTAYMVTDMLKSVVSSGTGTGASVPGLEVAGKTGTTTMDEEPGSPDSWFVGYTTNYTIAAWTGGYQINEETNKAKRVPLQDTSLSAKMFQQTMSHLSEGIETADFTRPDSVVEVTVEKGSNPAALASDSTPSENKVTELFVKGTEPTKVSERFEELDAVSGLSGSYNKDDNSIEVSWNYDTDSEEDVSFEVSASIDGGSMQSLSSTSDTSMEISDVEEGAEYTIQVVAKKGSLTSEPATTTVKVSDEEEADEEIPGVSNLSAEFDGSESIQATWSYDGPPASFEVSVNGETQNVSSQSIAISGVTPGDYTITVTPVSEEDSIRGPSESTSVTVPGEEAEEEEAEEEQPPEEESDETESDSDTGTDSDSGQSEDSGQDESNNSEENNDNSDGSDSGNNADSGSETEQPEEQEPASDPAEAGEGTDEVSPQEDGNGDSEE
ncbi:PBP1A family penicillin-binding protein [Oceanobacillus sp. J11TS1]|uniref:PBP1A family penicillin-binding protein n=1 Tax=Oceanobacillus sp. J11TS1 TaxID=2807191 RepID=UPI001B1D4945|nr:PBP1A family penicillin-binding protein [Oceanobacillus sp. J11TS1]GIO22652.1 penicillin-binding protein 1A/1B [Oceanobacillus sp. J11TS1]